MQRLDTIDKKLEGLDSKVEEVRGHLSTFAASQFDRTARLNISNLFGQQYSCEYVCQNVKDISFLLPWDFYVGSLTHSTAESQHLVSSRIAGRIISEQLPRRLLRTMEIKIFKAIRFQL